MGDAGSHWGKDGWLLKIYLFLGRNLMLEVRFHDMIRLNSVIRLQGYITKYIQQVELIMKLYKDQQGENCFFVFEYIQ